MRVSHERTVDLNLDLLSHDRDITFFLREDSDKPMVLVASGTGFAPIKAIIEQAAHKKTDRPMRLYWGERRPKDL
jgi:CDP-4-dehydro-6-deoxyglucose reductase, E3